MRSAGGQGKRAYRYARIASPPTDICLSLRGRFNKLSVNSARSNLLFDEHLLSKNLCHLTGDCFVGKTLRLRSARALPAMTEITILQALSPRHGSGTSSDLALPASCSNPLGHQESLRSLHRMKLEIRASSHIQCRALPCWAAAPANT